MTKQDHLKSEEAIKTVEARVRQDPGSPQANSPAILVLTAADVEFKAAIELAGVRDSLTERRRNVGGYVFVDLGFEVPVWLFQCRAGSGVAGGSLSRTHEALSILNPKPFAVLAVGIAFGLRKSKQALGDLLLAEQLQCYEPERRGKYVIKRGDKPSASTILVDWFRNCYHDWHHNNQNRPRLHKGLVVSGEKLVDDPEFVKGLLDSEPEAIGGEMEGAGLYAAAYASQTHWTVLKAICDWGIGKIDDAQEFAARNALDFVYHLLSQPFLVDAVKKDRQTVKTSPVPPPTVIEAATLRKTEAIDNVWGAVVHLCSQAPEILMVLDIITEEEEKTLDKTSEQVMALLRELRGSTISEYLGSLDRVDLDRPYIGEDLYLLFFNARALLGRILWVLRKQYELGDIRPWRQDSGTQELMKRILTEGEFRYVMSIPFGGIQYIKNAVQQLALELIKKLR